MAFFELDDVFTYQDANDIKKLWAGDTPPTDPGTGEVWLDISSTPNQLKRYNGSGWDTIGELAGDLLTKLKTVDGSGSGLDADKLDGQEGSYYRDASNLNAGTVPQARLSASDLLTLIKTVDGSGSDLDADKVDGLEAASFVRSDAEANVNAHTEWQDTYQVRLGTDADLRLQHNGTNSYIDNYTGNLYMRQLSHSANIYLKAENASGTMKTLLTLDPDTDRVTTKLDRSSLPDLWRDTTSNETQSPHIQTGHNNGTGDSENPEQTIIFDNSFTTTPRMTASAVICPAGCLIEDITTTSFTLNSRYANIYYDWWAIGKKT